MKTALVSGGTGFIGVALANELDNRGYKVTVVDMARNNYKYLNPTVGFELIDICKHEFYGTYDFIYHLASPAPFSLAPKEHISTNIWGTYNFIKSFPTSRVIFCSSSAAADANSFHGICKKAAEHFVNTHKNSVSVRFNNVFGEYQISEQSRIPSIITSLHLNKTYLIKGDGKDKIDYIYVYDLVEELIRIGESKIKGQTETGYGTPIKVIELYKLLSKISKKKENFKLVPVKKRPSIIHNIKYKIKEPRYGFLEGLRRTVRWYLEEGINGNMEGKSIHRV